MYLSHPLDPKDLAWPGEPVVEVTRCTDVGEETPFSSFITKLPNHCGTHMDAPRHFVKDGLSINELPIEYFCHKEVALIEIPKGEAEGITKEDLLPYVDILSKVSFAFYERGLRNIEPRTLLFIKMNAPIFQPVPGSIYLILSRI